MVDIICSHNTCHEYVYASKPLAPLLILLADSHQPFAPLLLAHLPKPARDAEAFAVRVRLVRTRRGNSDFNLGSFEVGRADG